MSAFHSLIPLLHYFKLLKWEWRFRPLFQQDLLPYPSQKDVAPSRQGQQVPTSEPIEEGHGRNTL